MRSILITIAVLAGGLWAPAARAQQADAFIGFGAAQAPSNFCGPPWTLLTPQLLPVWTRLGRPQFHEFREQLRQKGKLRSSVK